MSKIQLHQLYKLNRNKKELIQLLSPDIGSSNIELFHLKSKSQKKFNSELGKRGISIPTEKNPFLEECLLSIKEEAIAHIEKNRDVKKTRLDFDLAMIFHKNLPISRRVMNEYDFWRTINLFYLVEITKWRWEKNPENPNNWYSNSKSIFGRTLGLSFNLEEYKNFKTISYSSRNKRIDSFRYWWIGQKLYDNNKKYYYLEKLSEKFKEEEASVQDFLNHLEGNTLLSPDDRISKILANTILLSGRKFSEQEARSCFNRYNAFTNRQLMDAEEKLIRNEICLF